MATDTWSVPLRRAQDVASARDAAAHAMTAIGASVIKRTKFVTAVSEIARNAVIHGKGGYVTITVTGQGRQQTVVAKCTDRGPGIADLNQAMRDGFSTGGGLGLGLGGAKRLVDHFDIVSAPETGTRVVLESSAR